MNKFYGYAKTSIRVKPKHIILALLISLAGCTSNEGDTSLPANVSDVFLIRTAAEFGPVFLQASRLHGLKLVGGEHVDSVGLENSTFAWEFGAEETFNIQSQSILQSELNLVVRANDGLMQVAMVDDATVNAELADWRFIPLGNGRCHLINEALGTDLVLSAVNPSIGPVNPVSMSPDIVRYTIEMVGIDDALAQQWTVVRVGNPSVQFEPACIEE